MTEKLKEIIKNESTRLPKESQEVIKTFEWGTISEEIGKKYLLNEEEINDLQVEVALILLGIGDESLLSLNIENRVGTSKNESVKMTAEINQQIFVPMLEKRDQLIKNSSSFYNPSWKQSINFITSGGNYSVFEEENKDIEKPKVEYREVT